MNDNSDERVPIQANGLVEGATVNLETQVSGVLPQANGGTGGTSGGTLNDGEILIGSSGNPSVPSTLTAGTGIQISNGPGSITVSKVPLTLYTMTALPSETQVIASQTNIPLLGMQVGIADSGQYTLSFMAVFQTSDDHRDVSTSFFVNGVDSEMFRTHAALKKDLKQTITSTSSMFLSSGDTVSVHADSASTTTTFYQRTLIVQKVY